MCETGPINQQDGFKDDNEFGRTLSNPSSSWDLFFSGRAHLDIVKNLSTSPKDIEEPKFHEPHPREDLEALCNHPFQPIEETKESWTTSDGETPLEPEIEEFLICLSEDPLCTNETSHSKKYDLHGMIEGDMQIVLNEEVNQEHHDFIEHWFQTMTRLNHHSLLRQLFTSYHLNQLVPHVRVLIKVYCSNLNVSIFIILLRTWLHWKYSYT
jgi:hypothetical protein